MSAPIRVLVVDDSAFARKVVREMLSADLGIEVVGIARDGLDALEKIEELKPDVVTLDLVMPNLDGLGVLAALRGRPSPRVLVVSTADEESLLAVQALQAGAIDLVHKPTALATERLYELSTELVEKVKIVAAARPIEDGPPLSPRETPSVLPRSKVRAVVIGASTGGPQALSRILAELTPSFPVGVAVVLHMPVGYTRAFAERLNETCAIEILEAYEGLLLRPGQVVIGRAGVHMKLVRDGDEARVRLEKAPYDSLHRPSVNVLFGSAAEVYGPGVLGVILTGMGDDGVEGARAVRAAGGTILTESAASCVVYGMPRAVVEAGLSSASVPLAGMAAALTRAL